jgi:peptidoglycan-associated lipoprotein
MPKWPVPAASGQVARQPLEAPRISSSTWATACSSRRTRPTSRPTATATLDKQSQWLSRYPQYTFLVEGHADERGTREYNYSLSARRAEAVRDYLISRGIPGNRFKTVSYGKERPVAVCNDISCWSQNRRAVTVLSTGAGS